MASGTTPPSAVKDRVVRVFISSTFRDMHAERDHLVTVVFPELRERCEQLGLEFFDVDLRWGVPEFGVDGEKANSWEYCKKWINQVDPFFVCILGQRYGWAPKPHEIKDDEDRAMWNGRSITDMEIRHAVLSGRLQRRSLFYLRQPQVPPPPLTPIQIYHDFVDEELFAVEELTKLKDEIGHSRRLVRPYNCRWTGEGFDDLEAFGQIVLNDLWSSVLRDPRYVSKDAWRTALGTDPDDAPCYLDETVPLPEPLWRRIVALARPVPPTELVAERRQMAAFAERRRHGFFGRQNEITWLRKFVESTDDTKYPSRLCAVVAAPGQGKSALLAKVEYELRQDSSPPIVIAHYVGASERASDTRSLLYRIIQELDATGIAWPPEETRATDIDGLRQRVAECLASHAGGQRIVIILDALNQLTDGHDLNWLPQQLGPSVRVIVSCIDDPHAEEGYSACQVMQALRRRLPAPEFVPVPGLDESDIRDIVISYLYEYCRELDQCHINALCHLEQPRNPLYLRVLLNELRTLGGNDLNTIVPDIIANLDRKHPDTHHLFAWVVERLAQAFGHESVRLWCSYLALGRVGMSSLELVALFQAKCGGDAGKVALRIERGLRRYLQHRGGQLDFFHGQLRKVVEQRYLTSPAVRQLLHADLARHFRRAARDGQTRQWNTHATRPLAQLAYHQIYSGQLRIAHHILCDLSYGAACAQAGLLDTFLDDLALGQQQLGGKSLTPLQDAALHVVSALRGRPDCFAVLVVNELAGITLPSPLCFSVERARAKLNALGPWLCAQNRLGGGTKWPFRIIGLYPRLGIVLGADDEAGSVMICQLDTQRVISRHPGCWRSQAALHPLTGELAMAAKDGEIETCGCRTGIFLRQQSPVLAFLGDGILIIDQENCLVWHNGKNHQSVTLAESLPRSFCQVTITPDGNVAVLLAGDRLENQQVLILREVKGGHPDCQRLILHEGPLTAAAVDLSGHFLLAATMNRNLFIVDLATQSEVARTSLTCLSGRPLGRVHCSSIKVVNGQFQALFADDDGTIGHWDTERGSTQRLGSSKTLVALQWHGQEDRFFIAATHSLVVSSTHEKIDVRTGSEVKSCAIGSDGWITLALPQDRKIVWFNQGKSIAEFTSPTFIPNVIASAGRDGAVFVGSGTDFISMRPGEHPCPADSFKPLFDRPIVAVFPWTKNDAVAVSENGEAKFVCLKPRSERILHSEKSHWKHQCSCPINRAHGILFWGYSLLDSRSHLFVVQSNGKVESVLIGIESIHCACAEPDLPEIIAAVGDSVCRYHRQWGKWLMVTSRPTKAKYLAVFGKEHLLVVLDQDWIELWHRTDLRTVTSAYVPRKITSLSCSPPHVIIGIDDGRYLHFLLNNDRSTT